MRRILKPELRIATPPALIDRGSVAVIGLEAIRDKAGPRWERMRAAIHSHLEALLRQKLGPSDYYARIDDLSFLVSLPTASADEAQILCLRVAHELHQCLLGQCDMGKLRVARAVRLDGDELSCERLQGPILRRLAAAAGLRVVDDHDAGGDPPCGERFQPPIDASMTQNPLFVPVWDVQNEAITTYRCVPVVETASFGMPVPQKTAKAELSTLLSRMSYALRMLSSDLEAGRKYLVSFPISYDLLGSPVARMEITALCRSLPAAIRPYLQFEIGELPYGVPQSRLTEFVSLLRPFCRGVTAYLPARIPSYAAYQGTGLNAIGLSLSAGILANTEMGSEVFKLATAAQKLHLKAFLLDVPNVEMLLSAQKLNVYAVSGSIIGAPQEKPDGVKRVALESIAARELQPAA